ncbi:MAG TPA: YdeI/OmpD-associated family protein [Puia sp.]|nr:YdeI/OmpD-associated family protein [Puia sp.]
MIRFKTTILQFKEMGEKTGWSYIKVPAAQARQLKPDNKKSFRVKGRLDAHPISGMALIPMGGGDFILALKAEVRKAIRKEKGASLQVELEVDAKQITPPKDLLECLADEPRALEYFKSLPPSHQNYFGNWIKSAKTEGTRTRRIARVVDAMLKHQDYAGMIRAQREDREQLGEGPE